MGRRNHIDADLGEVSLFKSCSAHQLRSIAAAADRVAFGAGETVLHEGRRDHDVYVIVSGRAAVERSGQRVAELGPGECFGELAALSGVARTAAVVAIEPLEVLAVSSPALGALLEAVPVLGRRLLVRLAERLQRAEAVAGR